MVNRMNQIDLPLLQADLPTFLARVAQGEVFVIIRDKEPIAELRPISPPMQTLRPLGLAKDLVDIPPSFFDPLPPDILAAFNGEGE